MPTMDQIWSGQPFLGANWDGQGVNFGLFSEKAVSVDLCLFKNNDDSMPYEVFRLPENTDQIWHGYVPGLQPGSLYGYRVYGLHEPWNGLRFNPNKLLIDPYAKAIASTITINETFFSYSGSDLIIDDRDNAKIVPKCVVIDPSFPWGDDKLPRTPLAHSLIYEVHVKGFTKNHPEVPPHLRGTYAGLASPPIIDYLKKLGVTAVELLPIHQKVNDHYLAQHGLSNYWGYNTAAFFAPEPSYASCSGLGDQVREFKVMIKTLHAAGIEVILDVVYNHTGEGNQLGPTFSWRGIDNQAYYRLSEKPRFYVDYTGTGNTLNTRHPYVLQLIMDSLRYWVTEMHVDGFRFDLASALARQLHAVDQLSSFFTIIHQDPVLSRVKLIAEPWDVGDGGYQVGNFPILWAEWNGKYRDGVRRFWNGFGEGMADLAYRLSGSSDLYQSTGRKPYASINFITSHDGFTMRDLVSYEKKHNEANMENNSDGDNHNLSTNFGVEGQTDDQKINQKRFKQMKNFFFTLFLSQGVPMILGGDEFARTQKGNNNAYCQDNEISWFDWNWNDDQKALFEFVKRLSLFRKEHPILCRPRFFHGQEIQGSKDIAWLKPDGQEMTAREWTEGQAKALGILLNGKMTDVFDQYGKQITDDTLLILLNGGQNDVQFVFPADYKWELLIDTSSDQPFLSKKIEKGVLLEGLSAKVLRIQTP